jgi:ATP-dependent protease ClpP protease subunit
MIDITTLADAIKQAMQKEKTAWDEYCPILKKEVDGSTIMSVYLTEGIEAPSVYNELCHELRSLGPQDEVHMYINNGGGIIDSMVMIVDAMSASEAEVHVHISGSVASAATFPVMHADVLHVAPFTHFMIHNYSGGFGGKGKEAKDQMDFVNEEIGNTFKEIYKGFLTDEEIEKVIDDKDKWMGTDEVRERWANRKAYTDSLKKD